jgi:hypothetical protein
MVFPLLCPAHIGGRQFGWRDSGNCVVHPLNISVAPWITYVKTALDQFPQLLRILGQPLDLSLLLVDDALLCVDCV